MNDDPEQSYWETMAHIAQLPPIDQFFSALSSFGDLSPGDQRLLTYLLADLNELPAIQTEEEYLHYHGQFERMKLKLQKTDDLQAISMAWAVFLSLEAYSNRMQRELPR